MQAMGAHGRVVMAFETVPGIADIPPDGIGLSFIKSNIKADQNQNSSNVITGRRDPSEPYRGFIDVNGDLETPLDLRQTGYLLKAAFGSPTTTEENGQYKHVFKLGEDMPSFTLEQGFQDINTYAQYSGCKISKMSLSFGGDNELTVSTTIMGMKETIVDISMDAQAKNFPQNKLNFDNAYLKEGGENVAVATEVKLDIDFGLEGDTYTLGGGGYRSSVNDGIIQLSGNIKAFFSDRVLLNKAATGTKSSLEIPLIKGEDSLTITMPEVIYQRSTPGIDGPKGVYIEMKYNAFYADNVKNTAIEITLINDVANYDETPTGQGIEKAVIGSAIIGSSRVQ